MGQMTLYGDPANDPWDDPELLRELYHDEGLSLQEIGEQLGYDRTTIHRWMEHLGIERRGRGGGPKRTHFASFHTRKDGYEYWNSRSGSVLVHRLLAVSEYGFEKVSDGVIHHKTHIPWDNRPDNLEVLPSHREHTKLHRSLELYQKRMDEEQQTLL